MTCLQQGFIAQLVEHCTGFAEVMGANPVTASEFFLGFICNCLSYIITAKIPFTCNKMSFFPIEHVPYIKRVLGFVQLKGTFFLKPDMSFF